MALLGIDYGKAKVGLAVAEGLVASPLRVVHYETNRELASAVQRACEEYDIRTIVVGRPQQHGDIQAFIDWLRKEMTIPVVVEDEQLTTAFAKRLMRSWKGKAEDDALAAALILQSYIERTA